MSAWKPTFMSGMDLEFRDDGESVQALHTHNGSVLDPHFLINSNKRVATSDGTRLWLDIVDSPHINSLVNDVIIDFVSQTEIRVSSSYDKYIPAHDYSLWVRLLLCF